MGMHATILCAQHLQCAFKQADITVSNLQISQLLHLKEIDTC